MRFKRTIFVFLLTFFLISTGVIAFSNDDPLDAAAQMKKLEPFIGKWKTLSLFPGKDIQAPGDLEYRWVLGKEWLFVEFKGEHPLRPVWEAYAMIKYEPQKKCYLSFDFFNKNDPITMTGTWISPQTIRFETAAETGRSGIDYTINQDGTVYQENWLELKGQERKITLKTNYTRVTQ